MQSDKGGHHVVNVASNFDGLLTNQPSGSARRNLTAALTTCKHAKSCRRGPCSLQVFNIYSPVDSWKSLETLTS